MNCLPQPAPPRKLTARVGAAAPATARLPAVVTRARRPAPAAVPALALRATSLDKFEDGDIVTAEALLAKGILSKCEYGYKVLGNGKVTKKVTVQAAAFSQAAKEAIEAAGGKAEVV